MAFDTTGYLANISWPPPPNRPTQSYHRLDADWWVIDATDCVLGRLASFIAQRLRGKDRADYTPNTVNGDYVVVVNADKIALTGKKWDQKTYYRHTGHPGGLKQRSARAVLQGRSPEDVIIHAVRGMLPDNRLRPVALRRLRVFCGPTHHHQAQQPYPIDFASLNPKNVIRSQSMSSRPTSLGASVKESIEREGKRLEGVLQKDMAALRSELSVDFNKLEVRVGRVETSVDRVETQQKETNKLLRELIAKIG